jgi:hypothetical protein
MDLQATLAGSLHLHYLEAPRYEEQPLPIGRLLGRNGFKCYRYFRCGRGPGTGGHRRTYRVPDPGNGSHIEDWQATPTTAPYTRFLNDYGVVYSTNAVTWGLAAFTGERIRHEWVRRRARAAPNA